MPRSDRDDDRRGSRGGSARDSGRGRDDGRDERRAPRDDDRGGGSRRSGGYEYRGRTEEEVSRRANQSSGRYDSFLKQDVTWFKPRAGENTIRIIGWLNGADPDYDKLAERWGTHWGIDIITHRNVGVDKGTYLCLDKTIGEPCPICDAYHDDEEDLKPSDRVLCWLIDRQNEKAGPQLWAMPLGTSKDFSAISKVRGRGAEDGGFVMIDHPDEGYDIFFDREGEKIRTRYTRAALDREPTPLHEKQSKQDEWLDYVAEHRLPDLLKTYEPDYLLKVLSGQVSRREEDDGDSRGRDRDRGERSSRRGGDEDTRRGSRDRGDDRDSRRSRGRDEPEDEERGSSRGRGRGEEDEEASRPTRRGRGDDAEARDERPARRGRDEPEDAEDAPAERSSRRGRAEPEEERSSRRGRGRADPEPEEDPEPEPEEATTRYRPSKDSGKGKGKDKGDDGDADVDEARERLGRVGRRR